MSLKHLVAIARKETQHILRDRWTFILVLVTPISLLFIMAYALTVDIEDVPIGVMDHDQSTVSRDFVEQISAGEELDLVARPNSLEEMEELLVRGTIKAGVVIQPAFGRDLRAQRGLRLQVIIDGTEPDTGFFAMQQVTRRTEDFVVRSLPPGAGDLLRPVELSVRALYNPGIEPRVDLVPGLISMVLGLPALSVALALSREREHGTLEQILVTPISRADLLVGKMIPYIVVGMVNVIAIPILAMAAFGIPLRGSFILFFLLSVVFLFAMLSMGTLIGVFMRTQPAALALSFLVIFFPGFFLTGIFFPIAALPAELQMEAMLLPGTHYAIITRSIFLRAVGLEILWPNVLALAGLGVAFTAVAAFFFKKRLG